MTDLVERLRMTANCGIPDFTNSKLLDEAADEIKRLRGVIENPVAGVLDRLAELAIRVKQLEQENERLRAALIGEL